MARDGDTYSKPVLPPYTPAGGGNMVGGEKVGKETLARRVLLALEPHVRSAVRGKQRGSRE